MRTVLGLVQTALPLVIRMQIVRRRQRNAIDEKLERLEGLFNDSKQAQPVPLPICRAKDVRAR
jgi:hypothetical protein